MENEVGVVVAVRARKLLPREIRANEKSKWSLSSNSIWETGRNDNIFTFDKILPEATVNSQVYNDLAQGLVHSAMEGFNATIFAYGQTSSGKTHTMMGSPEEPGVLPLAVKDIFNYCSDCVDRRSFLLRVSYLEIYNETVTDLLNEKNAKLDIRENLQGEIYVKNLQEQVVQSEEDIHAAIAAGEKLRSVASTNMNDRSSRSHTIFKIVIESTEKGCEVENDDVERTVKISSLNLVDLAGSERAKQTGAEGIRLREGGHINTSLMVLSKVIAKLSDTEGSKGCIPFRESKLTRILQNSLGGNSRTAVICTIAPVALEETSSTLRFAKGAKMMKNKPIMNEIMNDKAIIVQYKKRIRALETELESNKAEREGDNRPSDGAFSELKGQLVGTKPQSHADEAKRRETFFQGPTGYYPSPSNKFIKTRVELDNSDRDIALELFPNITGRRRDSMDEFSCCSHEKQVDDLKASLKKSQEKNAKLQENLAGLEVMCMEMGDKSEEYIEEIQGKNEELKKALAEQKDKVSEMETILTAAGEEREGLLERREADKLSLQRAETNNNFIISEAETRANQADKKQSELLAKIAELEEELSTIQQLPAIAEEQCSSPGSKRRRSSIKSNRGSLSNTEGLLQQINELERAAITMQSENETLQQLYGQARGDLENAAKKDDYSSSEMENASEVESMQEQLSAQVDQLRQLEDQVLQSKVVIDEKTAALRLAGQDTLHLHSELEALHKQLVNEKAMFESVCKELKSELTYLADTILEEKGKYDALKNKNDDLLRAAGDQGQQMSLLQTRVTQTEGLVAARTEELDNAKQELLDMKLQKVESSEDSNTLSQGLSRAQEKVSTLELQLLVIEQSYEAKSAEALHNLATITELKTNQALIQDQMQQWKQAADESEGALRDKMNELDEAKAELMNLKLSNIDEEQNSSDQATILQLTDGVQVLKKELVEERSEYDASRKELADVKSDCVEASEELQLLKVNYRDLKNTAELIPDLEEKLRKEKEQVNLLVARLENKESTPLQLEQTEQLNIKLVQTEEQLAIKLEELDETKAEMMHLKLSNVDHDAEMKLMADAITDLQENIQSLKGLREADLTAFEEKQNAYKAAVAELEATIEGLRARELPEIVQIHCQTSPVKDQYTEENERLYEEIQHLKLELAEMTDHYGQMKCTLDLMEDQTQSFQTALAEKEAMLSNKMTEINNMSNDKFEAERNFEELLKQVDALMEDKRLLQSEIENSPKSEELLQQVNTLLEEKQLLQSQLQDSLQSNHGQTDPEQELSLLKCQISEKEELILQLNTQVLTLNESLQNSKDYAELKEDKICSMNIEMGSLRMQSNIISTLEEKVRSLNQQIESDQQEFVETQKRLQGNILKLQAQIVEIENLGGKEELNQTPSPQHLQAKILELEEKEFHFMEEKIDLETKLETIMEDHSASLTLMKEKEDTLIKHAQSLSEKSQLIENLQGQVSHEKSIASQLRGDIDNLMTSLTKKESTLKQQEEHLAGDFKNVLAAKDSEITVLRTDLESCADIIQELQDKSDKECADAEQSLKRLTQRNQEMECELRKLLEQAELSNERLGVVTEEVSTKEKMFAMQATTHLELQAKYAETEGRLSSVMSEKKELEIRLAASSEETHVEVAKLRRILEEHRVTIEAGAVELSNLQRQLEVKSEVLAEKEAVISTMRADLESCADIIEDLQGKFRKAVSDHDTVKQQLRQSESEGMKLRSKYTEAESEVRSLKVEKHELGLRLSAANEDKNAKVLEMKMVLDDYKNKIEKGGELLSKWQTDFMAKSAAVDQCKKEVVEWMRKLKESERDHDALKDRHELLMNEADKLERNCDETNANFQNNYEQWEKEIIRRKFVERKSGLVREGQSGSIEDFCAKSENDHTAFLESLEYTYRNMSPKCDRCDGKGKGVKRGSENTDPNAKVLPGDISYVASSKSVTLPLQSQQRSVSPQGNTSQNKSYNDRSSSSQNRSTSSENRSMSSQYKPKVSLNESNTSKTRTTPNPAAKDECKQQ